MSASSSLMRTGVSLIVLLALSVVSLNAQSTNSTSVDAYNVSLLAGIETSDSLKDGVGIEASFIRPTAIWGDGTYLYVGDGSALRRIEIASRNVTTVTRFAASGRNNQFSAPGAPFLSGIGGVWGDGTNIYATDVLDTNVRRINLATGLVDVLSGPTRIIFGLVGDGQYLYGGASAEHDIKRVDLSTGALSDFVTPPGPLDPSRCGLGSGCLGYFIPSPTSLSIDGDNIYATGYNTSLRIINRVTGQVTSSPDLPFLPTSVWGSNGILYFTEYAGSRIGKLTLATGTIEIVYPGATSNGPLGPIWGDGTYLYIIEADHILRLDLITGELQLFAGSPSAASVDGVGTSARFTNATNAWSDGVNLYIVDRTGSGPIRKLNLATAEVTTLSTPPVRAVWGDGTYLYATSYQTSLQLLRIRLTDNTITTFAPLSDPNGGYSITGDSTNIYVSETNLIERVPLDGTNVTSISITMPAFGGSPIWSDGTYLFIGFPGKIVRYSIATGNIGDFALLPASPSAMWSDGSNLFVSDDSVPSTDLHLLRVSIPNAAVERPIQGGTGEGAGTPINIPGYVYGVGDNLYLLSGTAIYRLTPTAMPSFLSFVVPDRGVSVNVSAPLQTGVTAGSGRIQLDTGSGSTSGLAILTYQESGIVTSETTVPATPPIQAGRLYASVADSVNTGLAIANPNDQAAVIQFYFTNTLGSMLGSGSITVAPHAQISRFLNEAPFVVSSPFGAPPATIEGTLTFTSTVPVSAVAVLISTNERSEFLMTAMPVSDLTQAPSSANAVIPDFAIGGGWTTSMTLVNLTDGAISGTLETHGDDGSISSTTPYAVAQRSSSVYNMTSTATLQKGWVRIVPSGSGTPAAAAIASFQQNGVTVMKTATAAFNPATSLRIYTEDGNTLQSGVAIANPTSRTATVYFQPTTSDGLPIGTPFPNVVSLTIPAFGHVSMFTKQLFVSPSFPLPASGIIRIWTDSPDGISVADFRTQTNERGDFIMTALPAFPETAVPATATYFPIMLQGNGFTTELVVFGDTPGESTSGTVQYYSQSGAPLVMPLN